MSLKIKPRIEFIAEKKLIGMRQTMSLADYRVGELWKSFIPKMKEITGKSNSDLISMANYNPSYFNNFKPTTKFEKWAAIEIKDYGEVPDGLEAFILPAGLYAIFHYKGSSADNSIFQYIFGEWLPNSEYNLDNRPHFEILGENYRNNDPESEEDIYIPVKPEISNI